MDDSVANARAGVDRRLLIGLVIALAVQALFVFSYVGALHSPTPHRVALGVVGSPAMPAAVGKSFSLKTVPTRARRLRCTRSTSGRSSAPSSSARRERSSSSFPPQARAPQLRSAPPSAQRPSPFTRRSRSFRFIPCRRATLPESCSFLLTMALVVGGYLSATMAMALGGPSTPGDAQSRSASWPCSAALLTATIAGPILGAIPTSKFLVLWALFVLIMAAVALATAALQTLLGPPGTLVVIVVFVIFGASGRRRFGARVVPARLLAHARPLPTCGRRHHRRPEHHLLRRERDHARARRARRISRRRRSCHGHRPQATAGKLPGRRGQTATAAAASAVVM